MHHVMLDLETLGHNSQSVIIAIGAIEFDPAKGLGRSYYTNVSPESCTRAGLQMDASTVLWWMQQSDEARKIFKQVAQPLTNALQSFAAWLPQGASVWGNGAPFDNVILSNAYSAVQLVRPWKYNADRCYRTLKALRPDITADERGGTYHNALDDAIYQASHAIKILKAMGS